MVVRRGTAPVVDAARLSLGRVDHVDAVGVDLAPGTTAPDFCFDVLSTPPAWITNLLRVRDVLVSPWGLNRRPRVPAGEGRVEPGARVGPFRVMTVADDEVLLGDDDKHLSFRTSFAVRDTDGAREGVCTTAVRTHGSFGRIYLRVILPFHHLMVPRLIGRADRDRSGSAG